MASIGAVIFSRLDADATIKARVHGNILPEYRDDLTPALVYEISIQEKDDTFEGTSHINYELVISVIDSSYKKAAETAELIITNLDRANWTDSTNGYRVIECHYENRDETYLERNAKSNRLAVVDLRFEFRITTTS